VGVTPEPGPVPVGAVVALPGAAVVVLGAVVEVVGAAVTTMTGNPPPPAIVVVDPPPPPVVVVDDPPPPEDDVDPPPVVVVAAKQAPLARVVVVPTQEKLLLIVAVQVTVLAPFVLDVEPVPDALHWLMLTAGAASLAGPAVAVQLTVPPGPPELLHWTIAWKPPVELGPAGV
jgi:hypothetical protein